MDRETTRTQLPAAFPLRPLAGSTHPRKAGRPLPRRRAALLRQLLAAAVFLFSSVFSLPADAQDNSLLRDIYTQAEDDYQLGRLEQALERLNAHIGDFQGNLRQNAYRLISLCYLAQDSLTLSENYAALLLEDNPYYTSVQDPIRFEDMINRLKSGQGATITTASNQAESLDEAPVPVTLITEDMIRISGARNLKEALIAYVPGMTNVECNEEMNIAMRGIYSSGQEKILIMLNGHRLNSYGTNVARPDFSISLEKVKQIEVLRGPASSLYGGVALTAVINIITKNGIEADGLKLKAGGGNYGQARADLLYGKHYLDLDFTFWGSLYNASGEKINVPVDEQLGTFPTPGNIIIGGYNHKPAYDIGATVKWKSLTLMYNTNFSKYVAPYTMSYFFGPYDYKAYRTFDGNRPGFANTTHHASVRYERQFSNISLRGTVAYDTENQVRYQVAGDTIPDYFEYKITPNGTDQRVLMTRGLFQYHNWQESNIQASLSASYQYQLGNSHHGTLSAGAQYNYFNLEDSYYLEGHRFDEVVNSFGNEKNLYTGNEVSFNGYVQLKHRWRNVILNLGIRQDMKERSNDAVITEWSPRLALIWVQPRFNLKASYSKSFVDAPYFYRNNTLDTTEGGADMDSEYLHSFQFTLATNNLTRSLDAEVNFFYNRATNLVVPLMLLYVNSGAIKTVGLELTAKYQAGRLKAFANATWQHVAEFELYHAINSTVYNVPKLTANLTAAYRIAKGLEAAANIYYTNDQTCHYETVAQTEDGLDFVERNISIPSLIRCNLTLNYRYRQAELGLGIHNLFDKHYSQGGTTIGPIRQPGRWVMGTVGYRF
jgi:iron complex outermembrane receptor protein